MKIVVLDDFQDAVRHLSAYAWLRDRLPSAEIAICRDYAYSVDALVERLIVADAVVLIRERTRLTSEVISRLPRLRFVVQTGPVARDGTAHVDIAACEARGIVILEGDGDSISAAELAWALILAARRRLPQYIQRLKEGRWQQSGFDSGRFPPNFGIGVSLNDETLGIWGYGRIGKILARYGTAFGMKVLVWGSESSRANARADGHEPAQSREELFRRADVLSLHLRQRESTLAAVTFEDLSRMKATSLFVNTSRAGLLAPGALARALEQGRPGMAALDVYEKEPLGKDEQLLHSERCLCSPHIGYVETKSYEMLFGSVFAKLVDYLGQLQMGNEGRV
ncbi:D-2-hydroxyacid dehydrogenase family protein [Caballeronia sp. GaOx3]|uniref:D-2-hydroxyacid dehydrogenase family protein n=1 Tax=Caballeronia sp. GaOx3 TaxID=2921740 RepID=UPI00202833A9|nr:D-2-hydroxyacid dehydrogenase family protein [Caballeronia sp. GaOx3]